jgi:Uri superfamily endonuclease
VDYLHAAGQVIAALYVLDSTLAKDIASQVECLWSQAVAALPGTRTPVPGFGASDCTLGCRAHLHLLPSTRWQALAQPLALAVGVAPDALHPITVQA